jgi:hypothetical protein
MVIHSPEAMTVGSYAGGGQGGYAMKLYIKATTTRSYEVEDVDVPRILAEFHDQDITTRYPDGRDWEDHLSTYPGELALEALVGDLEPVDTGETWTLETWDDE